MKASIPAAEERLHEDRVLALSERECRLIEIVASGESWETACDCEGIGPSYGTRAAARVRILRRLGLEDLTQLRLWASPITDRELARLCGKNGNYPQARRTVVSPTANLPAIAE